MTQERIYLTLEKSPGHPARLVDQHGRRVAGVIDIDMSQSKDAATVLHIEVYEKQADGTIITGSGAALTRVDMSKVAKVENEPPANRP